MSKSSSETTAPNAAGTRMEREAMDPQACLKALLAAVHEGDIDEASEYLFGLATWIEKGGYCPVVTPDMVEPVLASRRAMRDARR